MDLLTYLQEVTDLVGRAWPVIATALASYLVGRRKAHDASRGRRRQLASALLIELSYVESVLREMYADPAPLNHYWYVPLPLFERLLPETRDLSDHAMYLANTFFGLVLELRARRESVLNMPSRPPALQYAYRVKAGFAVQRLNELVVALRAEGGALPPTDDLVTISGGELPPLPAPSFGA